ncbi:MAG: amidohydrolase family protein [Dehalococcoidia bacterium]
MRPTILWTWLLLAAVGPAALASDLAVRGRIVHTMAGEPIQDGVIIIIDGKISAVGPADGIPVPDGMRLLEAAVVTPGLIDAHTVVGLAGYLNQPHDQDQLERSAPLQPELRAIDAYNAREPLVSWVRSFGITTIHTGHGPGEVISGQTLIAKTAGGNVDEAVMVPAAMLAVTLGEGAVVSRGEKRKKPGTRSKAVAMLREQLIKAQEYVAKRGRDEDEKRPPRDLGLEALSRVLAGEMPLLVTVHRHHDILSALRVQEEFDIPMVLDGATEAYLVMDRIREAKVPVFVHPSMTRAFREKENLSFTTAAALINAGIPVAFQSGFESYVPKTRVALLEAAVTLAYGLDFNQALAALTSQPARLLGIADRVGSLEVGKDGDVALYDGDPFEYTTHCTGVVIEGELVSEVVR